MCVCSVLRRRLELLSLDNKLALVVPPLKLCSDNGAMIAWCASEYYLAGHVS